MGARGLLQRLCLVGALAGGGLTLACDDVQAQAERDAGILGESCGDAGAVCEGSGGDDDVAMADGGEGSFAARLACDDLIAETCGTDDGPRCEEQPACVAARLLATYEPASCQAAQDNDATYPTCVLGACPRLVEKVCGSEGGETCEGRSACQIAGQLQAELDEGPTADDRARAEASCQSALEDETVFPACSG